MTGKREEGKDRGHGGGNLILGVGEGLSDRIQELLGYPESILSSWSTVSNTSPLGDEASLREDIG